MPDLFDYNKRKLWQHVDSMQLSIKATYTVLGIGLGLIFPISGWVLDIAFSGLAFSPASIVQIHQSNFLHYIIDSAPGILALVFFFLGRSVQMQLVDLKTAELLLNSTGEAIYGIDLSGNCTFANKTCLKLLGCESDQELLGKNMHELIHHTHNDGTPYPVEECKIYRAFKEESASHVTDELLWRLDGSSFDSEYRSFPMYKKEKVIGSVVSFTDITERQELERERELSEARVRDFFEISREGIIFHEKGIILDVNSRIEEILGYQLEEIIGHSVLDLVASESKEATQALIVSGMASSEEQIFNVIGQHKNGSTRQLEAHTTVHKYSGRRIRVVFLNDITTQVDAQARHAAILDSMNDAVITINEQGLINTFNPSAESMFGYLNQEIIGKNINVLMPKAHGSHHAEYIERYLKTGEAHIIGISGIEVEGTKKNGAAFPISITISELFVGGNRNFSGVIRDLTDKVALEKERELITAELSQLIDTANAPIFGLNPKLQINEWNKAAVKITGYEKEEVLDCLFIHEFINDIDKDAVSNIFTNALNGEETANFELHLNTKGGGTATILFNTTTRRGLDGSVTGVIGIGQDITGMLLAEAEAEQFSGELTHLVNVLDVPIFGTNSDGEITEWNEAAAELSGYSRDEMVGTYGIFNMILEEQQEDIIELFRRALADNSFVRNTELTLIRRDDSPRDLVMNLTTRRSASGEIVGVFGVVQDITELREKEHALQQAQKMEAVGQLTGGIAHDFNNLLSIIQGNLRFLQKDIGQTTTDIDELFEDAMSAVDDGASLTKRLLGFSRKRAIQSEIKNVGDTIESFSRFVTRTLGEHIELNVDLPEQDLFIKVDASLLENALLNLSINCRDAMPEGGTIVISASRYRHVGDNGDLMLAEGDYILISVKDDGCGISSQDLEHVYEPFFTTKDVGQGTGLGLSMVYGFVQQSGGACIVASLPGEGTTVTMYFPEQPAEKFSMTETENDSDLNLQASSVILVVEDEPRVRRVTLRDLQTLGYKTLEAENAQVARSMIESGEPVDLLFSDILMPGEMDGNMLGEWTRQNYPHIKVVLTSGYSKGKMDVDSDKAYPFPMVRKPYSIEKLAAQINSELGIEEI